MGIGSSAENPFSTEDMLVTKLIGPAYRNVKLVADNMASLQLLAEGAEVLIAAAGTVDTAVAAMNADREAVDASLVTLNGISLNVTALQLQVEDDAAATAVNANNAQNSAANAAASAAQAAASALEATNISGSNFLPLTGGTVTGNVLIEGELVTDPLPYGAAWAGSDRVANQHDVYTKITSMELLYGSANGLATLDGAGKLTAAQIPDVVLGAMRYQGTWNATTNTPGIPAAAEANKGHYYVVNVAGATNIGGLTDWEVGDWVISNGVTWEKIDNSDKVSSVVGLTGAITQAGLKAALALTKADVGLANVSNLAPADLPVSTAQAAADAALQAQIDTKAPIRSGQTVANPAAITPALADDYVDVTALAQPLTIEAPSGGAPTNMKPIILRIKDNGVSRALTWNAIYRVVGVTLPTATVVGKLLVVGVVYNLTDNKYDVVMVKKEA